MKQWTDVFDTRGMQAQLAREYGLSRQAINAWKKKRYVPKEHATRFQELTGVPREVSCHDFSWAEPRPLEQKQEA